jgi:putative ABC transport system ATP-binding protein
MSTQHTILSVTGLSKTYRSNSVETQVLKDVSLDIFRGEFVAIMGRSGAGKSTLLYQMSLLDHPTLGEVMIDGRQTSSLRSSERTHLRLHHLGYIFQDHALLPELTAVENVMLPLLAIGKSTFEAKERALRALDRVNMEARAGHLPSQLSGGEAQRVAIARAISHEPTLVFADEPTANLDSENGKAVLEIFSSLHESGQTVIMVTHERDYGLLADRIITLADGRIITPDA